MILKNLTVEDIFILQRAVIVFLKNWKGRNQHEFRAATLMRYKLSQLVRIHKQFGHDVQNVDTEGCVKVLLTALSLYECSHISRDKTNQVKGIKHKFLLTLQERTRTDRVSELSYIIIHKVSHKMPKKGRGKNKS